ncbi:MAG: HAMP domain-containing sensor histidine kinase [Lachnospiraceae bacterium]|nr:HAMP domain-containing sensor histidine kinase [Lachnospiraceae bacterium]
MSQSNINEKTQYSRKIWNLRQQGKLTEAIKVCGDAVHEFADSNFFYKIHGDLFFENGQLDEALDSYLKYLDKIKKEPEYFTNFTKFFQRLNYRKSIDERVFNHLAKIVVCEGYPYVLRNGMVRLLMDTFGVPEELEQAISRAMGKIQFEIVKADYEDICRKGKCREIIYLVRISEKTCIREEDSFNRYILKRLEGNKLYEQAVRWTKKILNYSSDAVIIRTLFRLCRESSDYSVAEEYLEKNDIVDWEEFNIQYELVMYFDSIGDEVSRNRALEYIEKSSVNSLPILRTLFKFYVKFNKLDKAKAVQEKIANFKKSRTTQKAKKETENIVWDRLRTLVTEQEHNRQLLAMSELIKGFSHELGQPITNIRYAVQLFYMKNKKTNQKISAEEQELFDGILRQTERVGKLLDRFSPIVSSKSIKEFFNVYEAICSIFDELSSRLHNEGIRYSVGGDKNCRIYGEKLQFGQVFYNLIINSIYAIRHRRTEGKIEVRIESRENILKIEFSDNGIGIPPELSRKIFNPFFSTKDKEVEEGGEGLGLFIVWNILKIFSGKIYVDEKYGQGAKFVIEINEKENKNVSHFSC